MGLTTNIVVRKLKEVQPRPPILPRRAGRKPAAHEPRRGMSRTAGRLRQILPVCWFRAVIHAAITAGFHGGTGAETGDVAVAAGNGAGLKKAAMPDVKHR